MLCLYPLPLNQEVQHHRLGSLDVVRQPVNLSNYPQPQTFRQANRYCEEAFVVARIGAAAPRMFRFDGRTWSPVTWSGDGPLTVYYNTDTLTFDASIGRIVQLTPDGFVSGDEDSTSLSGSRRPSS